MYVHTGRWYIQILWYVWKEAVDSQHMEPPLSRSSSCSKWGKIRGTWNANLQVGSNCTCCLVLVVWNITHLLEANSLSKYGYSWASVYQHSRLFLFQWRMAMLLAEWGAWGWLVLLKGLRFGQSLQICPIHFNSSNWGHSFWVIQAFMSSWAALTICNQVISVDKHLKVPTAAHCQLLLLSGEKHQLSFTSSLVCSSKYCSRRRQCNRRCAVSIVIAAEQAPALPPWSLAFSALARRCRWRWIDGDQRNSLNKLLLGNFQLLL